MQGLTGTIHGKLFFTSPFNIKDLLVSIIIPVYNAKRWLASTIESALNQTYADKEIIVVDDGSTDGSYETARRYEIHGVKIRKQTNAGAASARNFGLKIANGELFQFLDAGDLLSCDKIEKQVLALKGHPNKLAVCSYIQFTKDADLVNPVIHNQSHFIFSSNQPEGFLTNLWGANGESNFIQTNCWLVPKTLIQKAGLWRPYRCPDDDGEFFSRMILASEGVIYVPGVFNYYRMADGANQLSSVRQRKYLMNTLLTIDLKHKYLLQKGDSGSLRKAMAKQYLEFAVYQYPAQPVLARMALNRYKKIGVPAEAPLLGGKLVEWGKRRFGWRIIRLLQYYLRERTQDL